MGRDMHYTDKSMLTMPRPKQISERVKTIQLLGPSIGTIQCSTLVPGSMEIDEFEVSNTVTSRNESM
jgi:hypothetical protein